MNAKEYKDAKSRMEELLDILTEKGKLGKKQQLELDRISEAIALYEEKNYPFKADEKQKINGEL
jgi:hypothetical protein